MAESSGFFDAEWDDTLYNEETGTLGDYDLRYLMKEFTDYFSLFVGNGVFASPVNQCKVIPGTGNSVIVSSGWAFINGCYYHNDAPKEIALLPNQTANNRVDSIRLRYSEADRNITAIAFTGDTNIIRSEGTYDLKLADVIVAPYAVTVPAANISDARPNESVCGFVKGLIEVVDTKDLFDQYTGIFNEWFDTVRDQVTGDLAIRLQNEFEEINQNFINYKDETQQMIDEYHSETQTQIDNYDTSYQETLNESKQLVADYVEKDYVRPLETLTFTDKVCTIRDSKVTADSLVDVYFTADTIRVAERALIYVDSSDGVITLTALNQPTGTLKARIGVRR